MNFFHYNFQKQQTIQASPQKTDNQILVNGNLVDEKKDNTSIATKSPVQEKKLVEKPTDNQIPSAKQETIKQEKKPETKISKVIEVKDTEKIADSFVVTPDYIQQSKLESSM